MIDGQSGRVHGRQYRGRGLLLPPIIMKATMRMKTNVCLSHRSARSQRLSVAVLLWSCMPFVLAPDTVPKFGASA